MESQGMENSVLGKWNKEKTRLAILMPDKIDFKNKDGYKRQERSLHNDQGANSRRIYKSCKYTWYPPSVQFSSVAQSCTTLCDPMNHSTPGLPVHHQLPEFTQTHVHQVNDAIQPSHPLSSPSPPAPSPSQHQSLFQ